MGRCGLLRAYMLWLVLVSAVIAASRVHATSTPPPKWPHQEPSRRPHQTDGSGRPRTAGTSGFSTASSAHTPAASSSSRGYKSHGYYDLYQGYDKGFSDIIYWVPLVIIFGAGIIFLPVLGALFATLAAGTAGAAVSTTVAGRRRRRRELPTLEAALSALSALEKAVEKFRSLGKTT
ncbi:uncharacterized protein LOC144124588 isoform X1 [Amblyomma americanum]